MQPDTKPQPDLQALALTKAIRQHESGGNYNAVGDVGTSTGAYQYQPATWKAYSQEILGDSNAPMTPENQNAVTYGMIKKWKDSGLGPAEIAGKWNSGSERGWENKIGTTTINGQQVQYNTPEYVQGVVSNFKQIYPQVAQQYGGQVSQETPVQPVQQEQPQEQKGLLRKIGDFFTSGTQAFGKTIGEAIAAPKNAEEYAKAQESYSNTVSQLQTAIRQKVKNGEDPSRLQMALNQLLQTQPKLEDFTGQVINKTGEQVFGEGAMAGLEALSGGILEGGAKTVASKELSTLQKLNQGGKVGAAYGTITGTAGAMQQNQDLQGVVSSAIGGAALGYGLGGTLAGAGIVAHKAAQGIANSSLVNTILPETEARITKQIQLAKEAEAKVAKAYESSLPLTPTQRLKEQNLLNKTGDNVYTTLAKYNINVGSEEAVGQLQKVSDQFENAINYARQNEYGLFNVDEARNRAFAEINKNLSSEVARETAKRKIDKEITTLLRKNAGDVVKGANGETLVKSNLMERLRRTGNSWTPFNASDPEKVGQSAGWALANAVRDQVEKEGTFAAYREANREWGKVIHAQETIQKLIDSGKTFKQIGGLSGAITRRVLSGVLGFHTGGIAGTVLAEMGQEYAAKILSNPELRTYFDRKLIERFGNTKATPKQVAQLVDEIEKHIEERFSRLALPEPTPLGNPGNPIITPAPTTYEPQAQVINRQ